MQKAVFDFLEMSPTTDRMSCHYVQQTPAYLLTCLLAESSSSSSSSSSNSEDDVERRVSLSTAARPTLSKMTVNNSKQRHRRDGTDSDSSSSSETQTARTTTSIVPAPSSSSSSSSAAAAAASAGTVKQLPTDFQTLTSNSRIGLLQKFPVVFSRQVFICLSRCRFLLFCI